jgi:hypothetical protein
MDTRKRIGIEAAVSFGWLMDPGMTGVHLSRRGGAAAVTQSQRSLRIGSITILLAANDTSRLSIDADTLFM